MIEQYTALALQTALVGAVKRSEIQRNLDHICELIDAAVFLSELDMPVRLITLPEGALQGFNDEILQWEHARYVDEVAIDLPGPETNVLARKAVQHNTFIIAQAKARHPQFPGRFFNTAFIVDPTGEIIHRHYKTQTMVREHSTVPHDVWERWQELYGTGLDASYPVADTEIGRIGTLVCMEGSYPETARGLAMNGAEIIYRPSYPLPYVANGLWHVQNRARALDNTCYVIAPNLGNYKMNAQDEVAIDTFGGHTMIVDYQGRVLSDYEPGGVAGYAASVIDVEALRQYRSRSLWGNWLKDLRTEQFQAIYADPIVPANRAAHGHPGGHEEHENMIRGRIEALHVRGVWPRPDRVGASGGAA